MNPPPTWANIVWRGQPVKIEYQWVGTNRPDAPLVVFLHEGLGSVAMWREFPAALCAATGCRGLVYSRPGYGRSTPRAPDEHWGPDFLHRQAHEVLPALLRALSLDTLATRLMLHQYRSRLWPGLGKTTPWLQPPTRTLPFS
jgi:pimeloyl-ACP methyl ester carboxylesterase